MGEHEEVTEKTVANAKPQLKPPMTLSLVSSPTRERKKIDIDTQLLDQDCFAVPKVITRLLRHGASVPREDDRGVRFDDLMKKLRQNSMAFRNGQLMLG